MRACGCRATADPEEGSACLLSEPGEIDPRLLRFGFRSDGFSVDIDTTGTVPTVSWTKADEGNETALGATIILGTGRSPSP